MTKKVPIIIVSAAVVAAIIIVVAALFTQQRNYDNAHKPASLNFSFVIPEYDPATGSGVPVVIEGEDLDGNAVLERMAVKDASFQCEVLAGSYTVSIAGSPVNASGGIYAYPVNPVAIEVDAGSDDAAPAPVVVDDFTFTTIAPEDVTADQIEAIRAWLEQFEYPSDEITKFVDAIAASHQAALDRIAEEQRQAAEAAAAAAKAARIDRLTGTYYIMGTWIGAPANAPGMIRSLTFADNEVRIVGALSQAGTSSRLADKEWIFELTPNTKYSWHAEDGRHYMTMSEFAAEYSDGSFPAMEVVLNNGVVESIDVGD